MEFKKLNKEFENLLILVSMYENFLSKKVLNYEEEKFGRIKLSLLKKQILNKTSQIRKEIEEMKKENAI